jgi:hypothetical protein
MAKTTSGYDPPLDGTVKLVAPFVPEIASERLALADCQQSRVATAAHGNDRASGRRREEAFMG